VFSSYYGLFVLVRVWSNKSHEIQMLTFWAFTLCNIRGIHNVSQKINN